MGRAGYGLLSLLLLGLILLSMQGLFFSMVKTRRLQRELPSEPLAAAPAPVIRPTALPLLPGEGASALVPRRKSGSVPMFVEKRPRPAAAPARPEPASPSAAPAKAGAPVQRPMPKPLMRMLGAGQGAGFDGGSAAPAAAPETAPAAAAPAQEPAPYRQPLQQAPQPVLHPQPQPEPEELPARRPVRAVSRGGGAQEPAAPARQAAPAGFGVEQEPEPEEGE